MSTSYWIYAVSERLTQRFSVDEMISLIKYSSDLENLELEKNLSKHCQIFSFESELGFNELKSQLVKISHEIKIDLILKIWGTHRIKPGLLIMDMDSTLVQAETIDEIARVAGVVDKVSEITESAMRGELDFTQSLKARVSMLNGVSLDEIEAVHKRLPLTGGAVKLIENAGKHNCHTALVSGGFTYFASPIAERLGINTLSANILEISNNRLTGKVTGHIVDGESKLNTLLKLKDELSISTDEIIAIGDGANDLPMLNAAGTGIAFHAKPKVQDGSKANLNYNDLNAVSWICGW